MMALSKHIYSKLILSTILKPVESLKHPGIHKMLSKCTVGMNKYCAVDITLYYISWRKLHMYVLHSPLWMLSGQKMKTFLHYPVEYGNPL